MSTESIEQKLKSLLVQAMKQRDTQTADVVKMLRAKVLERTKAAGFDGEVNDELYLDVIGTYRKQMDKARVQFEEAGERGAENAAQARFEVEFCDRFLPKKLSEEETRALVVAAIAEAGISDPKQAGRVVGLVMKSHRGLVDAAVVKRLATDALSSE